ncbi:hypothetical protein QBC47DRAFT_394700 [Echria macrotheca]|uniref:2EXR domain-containing protein n=1 Tax=Echria macrotheca TaxID=438768 RepID=A0AAJ0F0I4_9PEZI|nr:hypothetical protein QBC47DRAFT_394700 [Echria macrotheca]
MGTPPPTVPTVTTTELATPPADDVPTRLTFNPKDYDEPTPLPTPQPPDSSPTFHLFPLFPPELRLKIWHHSFVPRAVELHTRRTHYADDVRGAPRWQSLSRNPAALSVSVEARAAALEAYTVALPLCHPDDLPLRITRRLLYVDPARDTVVVLGDMHYQRLTMLLEWFRDEDIRAGLKNRRKTAYGLCRLAMSVAPWAHVVGAATLKAFARTVFADMDEFTLFTYPETTPPAAWTGGRCVLEDARKDGETYRHFMVCWGTRFRDERGWMVVGKRPLRVVDVYFLEGW